MILYNLNIFLVESFYVFSYMYHIIWSEIFLVI